MFLSNDEITNGIKKLFEYYEGARHIVAHVSRSATKKEFYNQDPFEGFERYRNDKNLILQLIPFFPPIYRYINSDLKDNIDVLEGLARAPLFISYEKETAYVKSPLSLILDEHRSRRNGTKRNSDELYDRNNRTDRSCVQEDADGSLSINDGDLIRLALQAELDSYELIEDEKKRLGDVDLSYSAGIAKAVYLGETVHPSKYKNFESLKAASKELLEDPEFLKEVESIITNRAKDREQQMRKSIEETKFSDDSESFDIPQ